MPTGNTRRLQSVRRNKFEVIVEILEILSEQPLLRTRIMHKINTSWQVFEEIKGELIQKGLIEVISVDNSYSRNGFTITAKGRVALYHYHEFHKYLSEEVPLKASMR